MTTEQPKFFTTRFLNKKELIEFLQKENNSYSNFILKNLETTKEKPFIRHHIQPKHANGPDEEWNLIALSIQEHAQAHELLFNSYGNYFDFCAYCMMKDNQVEAMRAMRKQNHLNMKQKNVGFYNKQVQSELGRRPKKQRQPYARNEYVRNALQRGFVLQSKKTNDRVVIQPSECKSLVAVLDKWLNHPEMSEYLSVWLTCKNREKYTLYTGLTRMITGHRDKKTNKAVFSVAGWRIEGVFL
jgi:hypothetical protein